MRNAAAQTTAEPKGGSGPEEGQGARDGIANVDFERVASSRNGPGVDGAQACDTHAGESLGIEGRTGDDWLSREMGINLIVKRPYPAKRIVDLPLELVPN